MRNSALVILLLTACQLSARDLVSESSRSASEAWVSRRFASTQELYAVESALGPRLALIEGQTNNWRQAWTWGNHAAAGYMSATSRIERLYAPGSSNEWRDGDGRVWRIVTTQSTDRVITFGPGFQTSGGVAPPQSSYPFPGSDGLWDWGQEGDALSIQYLGSPQSFWTSSNFPSYPAILPPVQNAAGTATVSYVWVTTTQQVDTVALVSQLPGIVYSNSVSALTIYTNASGAATSWWQVASGVTNSGTFSQGTPGAITNGAQHVEFGASSPFFGYPNFNPADSALSIFAPAKFIYVDSNVGGFWGIKFRGTGEEGFTDIFGFIANGNTGEIQLGSRWPTYYMSLMSGGETRVTLKKDGKVGIGTTEPSEIFEVFGNCKSSGTNTAAVVRSQSSYLLPHLGTNTTISLIFTNGTMQAWEIAP